MKLLVVTPEYVPTAGGGIVTFYRHLLTAAARAGVDVTVLVGSAMHQPGGDTVVDGVRVVGLDAARFAALVPRFAHLAATPALARDLAAAWALHAQASTLAPFDVVECADWGLAAAPFTLAPIAPLFVRGHGSAGQIALHEPRVGEAPFAALLAAIERAVFARAGTMSSYGRGNVAAWRRDLARDVLHLEPALPVAPRAAAASAPWSLVLARVQAWKGPGVVAQALAHDASLPPLRWVGRDVPAGDGAPSTLAAWRAASPGWRDRVTHVDTVPAATARAWLHDARTVLVPSTWDVFNLAGAEAMATGAVLVTSDGAGVADLVDDGRNGFVFPSGDGIALADAWRRADALAPAARVRIGAAARETIATRLDPAAIAQANIAAWRATPAPIGRADPLDALLTPRDATSDDAAHAFLAQYGLRPLVRHVARRLVDKVRR